VPSLPPPPFPSRRGFESGIFYVERRTGREPTLRLRKVKRRVPAPQPEVLQVPYRDDWKSPSWVCSYCVIGAVVLWVLTR
jgi:hypothetical protein